ncbi:MAG: family peptidase [Frankiales bacterium]|nr:family peptidase [Frankiales bacterium]
MSRSRTGLLALALTAAGSTALAALAVVPASAAPGGSPDRADRAEQAVRAHPEQVALDGEDDLVPAGVRTDADGTSHVRFTRTRSGLPVLAGDLVVHQAADGALKGVSATTRRPLRASLQATVSREQAERTARDAAGNGATSLDAGQLQLDNREEGAPRLVWAVTVHGTQADGTPSDLLVLVDAKSGAVADRHEQVETAADDSSLYSGLVDLTDSPVSAGGFSLTDTRGGGLQRTTDLKGATTGNGTLYTGADQVWGTTPGEQAAVDVHHGAAKTYDYYLNTFGRRGIADDGKGALSRVHYGSAYNNAFWQDTCFCMTYGDGDGTSFTPLVELDVAGHEMSHGVMSREANLTYSRESGGLNEANSDIFGTLVEFYAANPEDAPDYFVGEKIRPSGRPLRFMDQPSKDGASFDCYTKRVGGADVHYSSGVGNHFFYLLAEGSGPKTIGTVAHNSPTCNGSTLAGIGQDAAAKIWYRAITTYMVSNTNYSGARAATLSAASDLFGGTGSPQYRAVAAAWSAVSVA